MYLLCIIWASSFKCPSLHKELWKWAMTQNVPVSPQKDYFSSKSLHEVWQSFKILVPLRAEKLNKFLNLDLSQWCGSFWEPPGRWLAILGCKHAPDFEKIRSSSQSLPTYQVLPHIVRLSSFTHPWIMTRPMHHLRWIKATGGMLLTTRTQDKNQSCFSHQDPELTACRPKVFKVLHH